LKIVYTRADNHTIRLCTRVRRLHKNFSSINTYVTTYYIAGTIDRTSIVYGLDAANKIRFNWTQSIFENTLKHILSLKYRCELLCTEILFIMYRTRSAIEITIFFHFEVFVSNINLNNFIIIKVLRIHLIGYYTIHFYMGTLTKPKPIIIVHTWFRLKFV